MAAEQFGPIHRTQLLDAGLSARMIERDLKHGRLSERYPSVYTVGHPHLRPEGRRKAALLYAGDGSFLAGRSATVHLDLLADARAAIDVCVVGRFARSRHDIRIHRRDRVYEGEVDAGGQIACARLPLALLDIAAGGRDHLVEKALDQAAILKILDMNALEALLARRAGQRGAGLLRSVLADHAIGEQITKSELEALCLRVLRGFGFPAPFTNRHVRGATEWWEADLVWPGARFVIETDGLKFHRTPARRERDRRRDADLMAAGWLVLRMTWRLLKRNPEAVAGAVRRCLT